MIEANVRDLYRKIKELEKQVQERDKVIELMREALTLAEGALDEIGPSQYPVTYSSIVEAMTA